MVGIYGIFFASGAIKHVLEKLEAEKNKIEIDLNACNVDTSNNSKQLQKLLLEDCVQP